MCLNDYDISDTRNSFFVRETHYAVGMKKGNETFSNIFENHYAYYLKVIDYKASNYSETI